MSYMMSDKNLHILLIGPRLDLKKKNVGGATLSFENLIKYFEKKGVQINIINTQRYKGILSFIYLLIGYFKFVWSCNVVFLNVSQKGIKYFSPLLYVLSKILNKKIITRPFGGEIKSQYESSGKIWKWIFRNTTLNSNIMYLQTRMLIDFFKPFTENLIQLKTSRNPVEKSMLRGDRSFEKRFLFVGHIKETKGINQLIEVKKILDDSYTIDLFGPIEDPNYEYLSQTNQPFYKGVLKGEKEVLSVMKEYDVVILPTYYQGEGYPGVILEAYSLGLPVITTNWKAIPEIVDVEKTGCLIEPKSVESLKEAILKFNKDNYQEMSDNALNYYLHNFQVDSIMEKVIKDIESIMEA
jgi:glycosyltransferase involved in cell wall biosynthesis